MNEASLALQTAVRGLLIASPALTAIVPAANILDRSGPATRFPSLVLGEGQTVEEDSLQTLERDVLRVYLDLHLWDQSADLGSVKAMAGVIRAAIRRSGQLTIDGYAMIDLCFPSMRFMRDRESDTPLSHGVVALSGLLQEAAFA